MAENESLDLSTPGGMRWNHALDAVMKGKASEFVAHKMSRKLPAALRKAMKEFGEYGVSLEAFMNARHDPKLLDKLVRKCQGHEYAHLFANTAKTLVEASNERLINAMVSGVIERVSDQIIQAAGGTDQWSDLRSLHQFMGEVKGLLDRDVQRLSRKLSDNPNWKPTAIRQRKDKTTNPTQDLLGMSLLVGVKK